MAISNNRFKGLEDTDSLAYNNIQTSPVSNRFRGLSDVQPVLNASVPKTVQPQTEPISDIQQPGVLSRVAKAVLPKPAEDFFGLNDKPASPIYEGIKKSATQVARTLYPVIPDKQTAEVFNQASLTLLNHPKVQPIVKEVAKRTSGTGVYSMVQATGPKTFSEAYQANKAAQAGDPSKWHQFLYQLGDSAPQTALGVGLNFVSYAGKPLSTAYWTALSASEQMESKGKVTSMGNIGIDVALDSMLGKSIEAIFKAPAEALFSVVKKNFIVEGGTEVAQDLLKMGNDYRNAKTDAERKAILQKGKEYFTSGQILMTLGVGGISGAGVATGAYMLNKAGGTTTVSDPDMVLPEPPGGNLPPPLSPPPEKLIEQVKKYKSAEEFVKGQKPIYRGGNEFVYDPKLDTGNTPFTTEKSVAQEFADKNGGVITERYISPQSKVLDASKIDMMDFAKEGYKTLSHDNIIEYADLKGYDVVDFTANKKGIGAMQEMQVINPEKLVTKSQLIDIWNKANQQIDKTKSVDTLQKEYNAEGPGHQKLNDFADTMVKNQTILPEEAIIIKTIFEGTNDKLLETLNLFENAKFTSTLGRFGGRRDGRGGIVPTTNKFQMQKGLAKRGIGISSRTFAHEFGHAGYYLVLTQQERNIVVEAFQRMKPAGRRSFFEGLGGNVGHYASNEREFFAQSFSDYVFENKVPAKTMEPLLKRVAKMFYENIKKLVTRKQPETIKAMSPLFEKILAGDPSTPLSEFAAKEPVSFKQELKNMLASHTEPFPSNPPTKEVPASIFQMPSGKLPAEPVQPTSQPTQPKLPIQGLPPDISETIEAIKPVIEGEKRTPISQRIRLLDYLRTPWKVFERMGIRPAYQELLKGYEAYTKELQQNIDKITNWSKQVPKESNEKIFRSLDGEKVALNPVETRVANEIKSWLAQWADRLGMSPDARISEYITHIFPFGKGGEIPEEIAYIINKKIPGSVYDPFLLQRQGAEGYIKDTWKALDAYVKRATRKVNMDPALEILKAESTKLTDTSQLNYLNRYVGVINMRPSELESVIDNHIKEKVGYLFGSRPTASITRTIRQTIARAKIGGSVTSFAKNLTQGFNTFSDLGTFYTAKGYMDLVKYGSKELDENGVLAAPFVEDITYSAVKKMAEKMDNVLFLNMNASELVNRGAAYYGAKGKFLNGKITNKEFKEAFGHDMPKNYTPTTKDAIEYGKFVAGKTQFAFGPLATPIGLSGDIAKTFAQFQTFGLKQAEFIGHMVGHREWAKLIRYIVSSMLLFQFVASAFGMKWNDSFTTLRWGYPPAIQFMIDLFQAGVFGEDKYGNKLKPAQRAKAVGKSLFTNVVPMGAQIQRGVEGYKTVAAGKSTTAGGKFQYKVEKTPINYARGVLFGKYNLPEAKAYYKKQDEKAKGKTSGQANRFKGL